MEQRSPAHLQRVKEKGRGVGGKIKKSRTARSGETATYPLKM